MLNYTRLKIRISLNHSNILGPCATYEENKVFENITPGVYWQHLISFVTYEFAQTHYVKLH
jgi:hypothetical protein